MGMTIGFYAVAPAIENGLMIKFTFSLFNMVLIRSKPKLRE